MFNKIKYTLVPENLLEDGLLESAIVLTEMTNIESPIILFNDSMDLGLDSVYEDEGIPSEDVRYIEADTLDKVLEQECKNDNYGNCIILNGFDITLDDIRNKYSALSTKSGKIFSINVITQKRKYTNFSVSVPSNVNDMYSEVEWREYKDDIQAQFDESLEDDTEEYKINADNHIDITVDEFLDILGIKGEKAEINKNENKVIPFYSNEPKNKFNMEDADTIYSYENCQGYTEIGMNKDNLILGNETGDIVVPLNHIDFIIDTLEKLKYNK